jgi:hypothetical protein
MIEIALSTRGKGAGLKVKVDDAVAQALAGRRIFLSSRGWYPSITVWHDGKKHVVCLHRFILGLMPGDRQLVDHINGDAFDCRRENLRIATWKQNAINRRAFGISGFKGVRPMDRRFGAWINGKYIGRFDTPEQAALAYDAKARALWGSDAAFNFPQAGEISCRRAA